ncbi:MAG: SAM-dependent chlorinase/fluorinase [Planctomycetes bacterium]|nr:SAM-dependent chlorinase/fluorinase [Planctomycetota bacterium]
MSRSIITITTDFGGGSPYVAQMKGVILSINPEAMLVDITHDIAPQNVRQGALVLEEVTQRFPRGTIHVAVVDPGVGTERKIVCAQIAGHYYVAPDNGLLSSVAIVESPTQIVSLTNHGYWLPEISRTFHGRDIIAPVAAHLSLATPMGQFGQPINELTMLDWPKPKTGANRITGEVISIDSFGNLISNITAESLTAVHDLSSTAVTCAGQTTHGIAETYAQRPPGSLVALIGSAGKLEVAVADGNAAQKISARVGDTITVTW